MPRVDWTWACSVPWAGAAVFCPSRSSSVWRDTGHLGAWNACQSRCLTVVAGGFGEHSGTCRLRRRVARRQATAWMGTLSWIRTRGG